MSTEPVAAREWRSHAACREVDPDIFFPTAEHGRMRAREVAAAKAVCARCPVRAECLAVAVRIPDGIAGGLTAEERRGLHRTSDGATPAPELVAEVARVEKGRAAAPRWVGRC
jgi:WhiB family redox-sensing transcriptional regulator